LHPGTPTTYDLTEADINTLRTYTTANNVQLKVGTAGGYTEHGEFYAVRLGPKYFADGTGPSGNWQGANDYGDGIGDTCGQLAALISSQAGALRGATVSIGDFLESETGNKVGQTKAGVNTLCGGDVCSPPYKVTAALWDAKIDTMSFGPHVGAACDCYHVKYLGAFAITGWDQSTKSVLGYFTSMATNGGITPGAPGPSQGVGLRK